jgi:hypothetical protein
MRPRLSLTLLVAVMVVIEAAAAGAALAGDRMSLVRDRTPRVPVEAPGAPWSRPFSVLAGGGTERPRDGVVAGRADLGTVWTAARDGAGRVVLSSTSGLWAVGAGGRLARVAGVPSDRDHREQLAALGDGSVAVAAGRSAVVYVVAAGADRAAPFASTSEPPPLGIGAAADGSLIAIAGGRLLQRQGAGLVAAGSRLWEDDGLRQPRGAGSLPGGGLLVGTLLDEGNPDSDDGSVLAVQGSAAPRAVYAPPSAAAVRRVAVLGSGRALIDTNASTEGDLDVRPLELAAGPIVDPQMFSSGGAGDFAGWIARRRVLVRQVDGGLLRTRWAGPPADDVAPDGNDDNILVASAGRLWSTRPGVGAPDLAGLWRGRVAVGLGAAGRVTVAARDRGGRVVARSVRTLPAGRSVVRLDGLPHRGLLRVAIDAGGQGTTSAWAFAGPRRLGPREAGGVLASVARRLYVFFEGAAAHGVDRCTPTAASTVRCRWSTAGSAVPTTERSVRLTLGPAGYRLRATPAHPSPRSGRNTHLLGGPRAG